MKIRKVCTPRCLGILLLVCAVEVVWQNAAIGDDATPLHDVEFTPIFNGRDLTGWSGDTKHWAVNDGVLTCEDHAGNLFSEHEYDDFVIRCDFRLTAGANNGIGLRAPLGSKWVSGDGMEIQILDDGVEKLRELKPYQCHGSIYGFAPAKRGALKPVGEWNEQEVRCIGRSVVVVLNGKKIVDANLDNYEFDPAPDGRVRPGIKRSKGHLALLGHSERAEFRNLRVHEIDGPKGSSP